MPEPCLGKWSFNRRYLFRRSSRLSTNPALPEALAARTSAFDRMAPKGLKEVEAPVFSDVTLLLASGVLADAPGSVGPWEAATS